MEQSGRGLLNQPVLLLNRFCSPVTVTTARRALVLLYGGSGRALDERGETYEFSAWRCLPARSDDEALPVVNGALAHPSRVATDSLRSGSPHGCTADAAQPDAARRLALSILRATRLTPRTERRSRAAALSWRRRQLGESGGFLPRLQFARRAVARREKPKCLCSVCQSRPQLVDRGANRHEHAIAVQRVGSRFSIADSAYLGLCCAHAHRKSRFYFAFEFASLSLLVACGGSAANGGEAQSPAEPAAEPSPRSDDSPRPHRQSQARNQRRIRRQRAISQKQRPPPLPARAVRWQKKPAPWR